MNEYSSVPDIKDQAPDSGASSYGDKTLDHDEILAQVKCWFLEDGAHCREFHSEARTAFRYRAGDQWEDEIKSELELQQRAPITFNRIDPVIDAVVGAEIVNRQEVRYVPRQVGDAPANEVLSEAARWFRDECDAEHEESAAFADAATCGMGWTETFLDYENNPDGEPQVKRTDPMEMYWDASCKEANLVNSRRMYRIRTKVPLDECKARWPEFADDDAAYDATWAAGESEEEIPHRSEVRRYDKRDSNMEEGHEDQMVTLAQVQWFEREVYYRAMIMDPMSMQTQTMEFSEAEDSKMKQRALGMGLMYRSIRQVKKCFYEAFIGSKVLECYKMTAPSGKPATFFKFVPITGKLDRHTGLFYGLVRGMMGPQQFANKWLSTAVEIMARSAKGGLLLEEDAVADTEEFEEKWAIPGTNSYVKAGAISGNKLQPKPKTEFPNDFMQMTQFAISSIRDVTGVSVELLGMANMDQAASLEYQRRQASTTILSPLFDSLRRYRRIQGRVLLFYITEYLSDGRLVKITGVESAQYVPLIKQPGVTEYDVIVDDAPTSPNQKEMVWASLVQMMPLIQNMQLPPQVILELMDYSPIPASVVAKVKRSVAQAQQNAPPPPPDPLTILAKESEIKMQGEQQKNQADMAKMQAGLQIEQTKSIDNIRSKQREHALDLSHKMRMDELEYAMELRKAQLKMGEMRFKAETDRTSKAEDLQIKRFDAEQKSKETMDSGASLIKPVADALSGSLLEGLKELAKAHSDSTQSLHIAIAKPRKRTLMRGKDGRASHAIEEIME